ncbi:unnamed protein product [Rotaria sordida]|uniref:Acetylserotonin O-methyltransferase n=1 Tax=Rotaria sordida TaxID=392033 RepID=A0A820AAT9_9BILA|nr:unnamed protein product [Rotaria sordida]CAF4186446.1 unnamed protein product [Rotaria sordida]
MPKSTRELTTASGAHPAALQRLLRTLTCAQIVTEVQQDHFILTPLRTCLQTTVSYSVHAAALMWGDPFLWKSFGNLEQTIRTGQTAFDTQFGMSFFEYQQKYKPDFCTTYNACMNASSRHVEVAKTYTTGFANAHHVLDVGGGLGGLLHILLKQYPHLRGTLYDLPHVVADAQPFKENNNGRYALISGNIFESVPSGADIYILSHVLMDHDDEKARIILRNCRRAMSGTTTTCLLIVEIMLNNTNASSNQTGHLSDLTMLVLTGGRHRSEKEFQTLVESENFFVRACISLPTVDTIIECLPV